MLVPMLLTRYGLNLVVGKSFDLKNKFDQLFRNLFHKITKLLQSYNTKKDIYLYVYIYMARLITHIMI